MAYYEKFSEQEIPYGTLEKFGLTQTMVEDLPQYPGGATEFLKWLTKNLRYPTVARNNHTQGKVVAVFYVEKDGSISGVKITKSLSPECDKEALRVLNMMPHWQPGVYHDQPCRTKVCIPIVFKL